MAQNILTFGKFYYILMVTWKSTEPHTRTLNQLTLSWNIKDKLKYKKNLAWHSHNFLLPYIAVEYIYIFYYYISTSFIFNLNFLRFVVEWIICLYIYCLKFLNLLLYFAWVQHHSLNFYQETIYSGSQINYVKWIIHTFVAINLNFKIYFKIYRVNLT